MLINQSEKQPDLSICCGPVFQRGGDIQNQPIGQKSLYNCILQHFQVVQSPIANDFLNLSIGDQMEPQLVPKLLLHVSTIELHNIMLSPPEEGGLKEARNEHNNIIISDSTLRNILTPQLNKMTSQYAVMCGCGCCISAKSMHSFLFTCRNRRLEKLKDRSHNTQNRRYGEISSRIF